MNGIIRLKKDKNEFKEYPSKFGFAYSKCIPLPKAKFKQLNNKRVKKPSFKSLLDKDKRKKDGLINTDIT